MTVPVLRQIQLMRPLWSFPEERRPIRSKISGRPMGPEVQAILPRLREVALQRLADTLDSITWSTDFEPDWIGKIIYFIVYRYVSIQTRFLSQVLKLLRNSFDFNKTLEWLSFLKMISSALLIDNYRSQ